MINYPKSIIIVLSKSIGTATSVVFAIHWRHLGLGSKGKYETIDQNFQLLFSDIYVKQLRICHLWW